MWTSQLRAERTQQKARQRWFAAGLIAKCNTPSLYQYCGYGAVVKSGE
jgi:hypothetical protein